MLRFKRPWFFSNTYPGIEPDFDDAAIDLVAVRHGLADERVSPTLQLGVDAWRSHMDLLTGPPARARSVLAWARDLVASPPSRRTRARLAKQARQGWLRAAWRRNKPFAPATPVELRINEIERLERQALERYHQQERRARQRLAAAVVNQGEYLRSGDLILTCDGGCNAHFRSKLYHRGGPAPATRLETLRALARSTGWSTDGGDYCPDCKPKAAWHRPAVWEMGLSHGQ